MNTKTATSESLADKPDSSPEASGQPNLNDLESLQQAFQAFNETTRHLQVSYEKLQERIQTLDLELERKNAELERNLKEKEEVQNYLNNILESLTTGVIVLNQSGQITTFNQSAGTITGRNPDDCLHLTLPDILESDRIHNLVGRLQQHPEQALLQEEELHTPHQGRLKIRVSASPVKGPDQQPTGTVLILQDITHLKQLEEEAQRNHRLRAMGEMAAGIAHEIRNPLGSIELFASILKKDLQQDPDQESLTNHILSGVKNMDRIISSLLLFAKSPEPSRRQCDINGLMDDLLNSRTQVQWPEGIDVTRDFDTLPVLAAGDRELLEQVFLNFIRNALEAMPEGGKLHLQTRIGPAPAKDSLHRRYVSVTISDTGVGIASGDREHIFNPFFSTRDKGTGLGLAIVHNIIKAHQGTIDVESREGQGTKFIVKIPGWDENTL